LRRANSSFTDDDDREGEGDLIVAASLCTAEKMAFIIRHTSGIVCAPITTDDARRLRLDPMVAHNDSSHTTAFTVSIDYKPDGGTGISADERASCCRALANPNAGASDFARPGHIFPLIARDGGVLLRSGHTEAAVDLCKLSGLPPVGVISELMNDDGTVMKGEQVVRFAHAHKLKHVTIADMIAYRQAREKLIERVATFTAESPIGPLQGYAYRSPFDEIAHAAFVYNGIGDGKERADAAAPGPTSSRISSPARRACRPCCGISRTLAAACWSICAMAPPAFPSNLSASRKRRKPIATNNGARSASARRSCVISASPRSGT
jgi:3,4-dihydroxy 2-butanone 4-phosphate synthase/GTP cyclohydrolase II